MLISSATIFAQTCYDRDHKKGVDAYNKGEYKKAISYFSHASGCPDKSASNDLKTWIDRCNTKIAEQNKPAAPPQQQTQVLEPPPDKLFVSDSTVYFNATEITGLKTINIDTNKSWTFEYNNKAWCKAEKSIDLKTLRISCIEQNISLQAREAKILIMAGSKQQIILVKQSGITNPLAMAKKYEESGNTDIAVKYYQVCANQVGNTECRSWLGTYYLRAAMYDNAFKLLQLAAAYNDRRAQNNLGFMYEFGLGTTKDETTAVIYYQLSAEQGYAAAQYNLARMYQTGRGGLKKNLDTAKLWYRKAAGQGDSDAIYALSKFK
jgi:tetratricopeptide (TPR) repeat protein